MTTNANKLCRSRADYFNSSPHKPPLASRAKEGEYMHQLNFPLHYQPRACDFSSHPNHNFSRGGCGGVIKGERSVVLAEMQAEGKENLRGRRSNDWKRVAFPPRSYLKQLFAYNSVIPKKHSWEGWYGNPYISLP